MITSREEMQQLKKAKSLKIEGKPIAEASQILKRKGMKLRVVESGGIPNYVSYDEKKDYTRVNVSARNGVILNIKSIG